MSRRRLNSAQNHRVYLQKDEEMVGDGQVQKLASTKVGEEGRRIGFRVLELVFEGSAGMPSGHASMTSFC